MNVNDLFQNGMARRITTAGAPLLAVAILFVGRNLSLDAADAHKPDSENDTNITIVLASDVEWTPLNPARGDKGPKAGTLWGDRAGLGETGFLVKFADGFSSPPHTHNVTYRGVVISGQIHNDDPEAAEMWMPQGSFWTQPAGEVHITAASGTDNMAYIEIERGPYLVLPTEEATDNGERPINVHQSNIVWLDATHITWIERTHPGAEGPEIAFLWGKPEEDEATGTLLKLPAGFRGEIRSGSSFFRSVVIEGQPSLRGTNETEAKTLEPGSYFRSKGPSSFHLTNEGDEATVLYLRTAGSYTVNPTETTK
tara:strand:- start:2738 stop:3670 length:933 start_codon:yes stop_codon:yes gene_type:complete